MIGALARECADRHPAADHLAERREVGLDLVVRRRAAAADRKPEITSSKISSAPCARGQSSRSARRNSGRCSSRPLFAGTGSMIKAAIALAFAPRTAAPRPRCRRAAARACRAASSSGTPSRWLPERRKAGAGRDEQVIDVAVIAAGELHDEVAARRAAREPDRAHHGLGARRHEAHLLDAGISRDDFLGELHSRRRRGAVRHAAAARALDGRDDLRMRVAQDQRAPRADEVEVARGRRRR